MLRIHFLNVGHGDCTVIKHPSGRLTMIDINNSQEFDRESFDEELNEERQKVAQNPLTGGLGSLRPYASNLLMGSSVIRDYAVEQTARAAVAERAKHELTDPIAFLKTYYPNQRLWRFVLTHPDLDHMRGLKSLRENVGFDNFWDTENTKPTPTYRNDADKEDWEFYQTLRAGMLGTNIKKYTRGDSFFAFGKEEDGRSGGDNMEILSPTPALVGACNTSKKSNDLSIVLRVHHGGRCVLLPGDAEAPAWDDMQNFYGTRLKSDFLKASHHGRDSGYHLETLKLIDPIMTFVSVGRKPDTDACRKYRQQTGRRVPSTRYYGNIWLEIHDNGDWRWSVQRNAENS